MIESRDYCSATAQPQTARHGPPPPLVTALMKFSARSSESNRSANAAIDMVDACQCDAAVPMYSVYELGRCWSVRYRDDVAAGVGRQSLSSQVAFSGRRRLS